MARMKIRFYSSIHKSESIFYHVSWKYIPLPACCSIIDKYRFRQRGKRETTNKHAAIVMDSLHCEVQYVNVFSVWCSNFSSRGGLLEKKMNEQERDRGRENKRMRNELRWVRHLHSLPVFFRREGEEKRRGGCSVEGGLKKTSARWRPFWRLQRSCTLGKG